MNALRLRALSKVACQTTISPLSGTPNGSAHLPSLETQTPLADRGAQDKLKISQTDGWLTVSQLPSIDDLFESRVHFGHKRNLRNPWMRPYIFGSRMNMDIINLAFTKRLISKALTFLANIVHRQGVVLFVTNHPQHVIPVERMAQQCGEYAHCRDWQKGTFIDYSKYRFWDIYRVYSIFLSLKVLKSGKNDKNLNFAITTVPFGEQHPAVVECSKSLIPTIALCDTDTDPSLITYPIPANDDSMTSVLLFCKLFESCVMQAKQLTLPSSGANEEFADSTSEAAQRAEDLIDKTPGKLEC